MAKSLLLGGGMLFWPVSSFLPTFLTIFSIFSSENVLKCFFGLPPRPSTCRHPPPTPLNAPCGAPEPNLSLGVSLSLLGVSPKRAKSLLLGRGIRYLTSKVDMDHCRFSIVLHFFRPFVKRGGSFQGEARRSGVI